MPLNVDELLQPIPGDNPSGADLRYDPVYDEIKEARRQEDDEAPQGEWARERKIAEWPVVIKLATEVLANKSKDLQLAAWLDRSAPQAGGLFRSARRPPADRRACWRNTGTRCIRRSKTATPNCAPRRFPGSGSSSTYRR